MLNKYELKRFKKIIGEKDEGLSDVFSALSDPTRCHIFRSFIKQKELCVSDIAKGMNVSMSLASQHLKILATTKLLAKERRGRVIYYFLNHENPMVKAIIKAVQ